jgi:hypothetical protein
MLNFRNKINILLKRNKKSFTVKEIIEYFNQDGIFAILFIITLPTSIPSPAYALGSSTIIGGFITLLLSFQLLLGYDTAYLPEFILKKKFNISSFRKIYHTRIDFILLKMEKIFKKRNKNAFGYLLLKLSALLMILNSFLMMIPLIMTNWLPSTTVTFLSFSYLFKDGFMFVVSLFFALSVIIFYCFAFNFIISYLIVYKHHFLKKIDDWKKLMIGKN